MNYRVEWTPSAEQELAAIWVDASDRSEITTSANSIDKSLAQNPFQDSESRQGASRVLFISPLTVYFDIDEAEKLVTVWSVWHRVATG